MHLEQGPAGSEHSIPGAYLQGSEKHPQPSPLADSTGIGHPFTPYRELT